VLKDVLDAQLRVVGIGWERFGAFPGVSFVGWRESLVDEYRRSYLVVAPILGGGGTKLKVVEAMAASRPVVTTRVGGEGLPGSRGLRVCERPQAFAFDMCRFLTDAWEASESGAANRVAVADLKWSSVWGRAAIDLDVLMATS
jgi:glycosyltransferase involved in cell wall biosynthesis